MTECIFCKIINGDVPAYKIYEDRLVIAILDHRPVREGHAMIIPKKHVDHFIDLENDVAAHICRTGNVLGKKIQSVLKPKRVGFAVAGFGVPHAHYHVIPMHGEQDITSSQYAAIDKGEIKFKMDHIPILEEKEQIRLTELLKI